MEKKLDYRAGLRTASIVYLILAVLEVVVTVLTWLMGDYDAAAMSAASGLPESTVHAVIYGILGLTAVAVLLKVWLGVAGIRQVNGKPVGKAHIVIATIMAVLGIISFVLDLVGVDAGTTTVSDAALTAANFSMAVMYVSYAKAIRKGL